MFVLADLIRVTRLLSLVPGHTGVTYILWMFEIRKLVIHGKVVVVIHDIFTDVSRINQVKTLKEF